MVSLCTRAYRAIGRAISGYGCVKAQGWPGERDGVTQRPGYPYIEGLEERTLLTGAIQVAADVRPGELVSIESIVALEHKVYFKEWFASSLWSCAGTDAAKAVVGSAANFTDLTATTTRIFARDVFSGAFWTSTGTVGSVTQLIVPELKSDQGFHFAYGNQLFFAGKNTGDVTTAWVSDGTVAGTYQLTTGQVNTVMKPIVSGDSLYFVARNGTEDWLYKSDGTAAGTSAIWKIAAIFGNELASLNGNVVVSLPSKLWVVTPDGAAAELADIFNATNLAYWNGKVYFQNGQSLWSTDGTKTGTSQVVSLTYGSPSHFTPLGSQLLFLAGADSTFDLHWWSTDGTTDGTQQVSTASVSVLINNTQIAVAGQHVFFPATTTAQGTELWMTDGTGAGTVMVQDLSPGTGSSSPGPMVGLDDTVYFQASPEAFATKLFKYSLDGASSISGTVYTDSNYNGVHDSGEPALPGITVYDDVNNNDVLDAGESQAQTDPDGFYLITGLAAGAHSVRIVRPLGQIQTAPAYNAASNVSLTSRQDVAGVSFGVLATVSTTTTLTSSLPAPTYGHGVSFIATVVSISGILTGSVQFQIDGVNAGLPVTLGANGIARYTTGTLSAGSHTITAGYSGSANALYTGSNGSMSQSVNPAGLTVSATPQTRAYGQVNPTLTGSLTGLVASDGITVSYGTSATPLSHPDDYSITPTLNDPKGKLGNYTLTLNSSTLTISKASQTIIWAAPSAITYGASLSDAQFNATATGITGGSLPGTLAYSLPAGTILNAGNRTLRVTAAATSDYDEATLDVTLVVNKALLGVLANPQRTTYGQAIPAPTGTLTGVLGDDGITASYATSATQFSHAGAYAITPAWNDPKDKLGNYSLTLNTSTLTIDKADQAITWATPAPILYGTRLRGALNAVVTGIAGGSTLGVLTYDLSAGVVPNAGNHTLTVTAAATADYNQATASVNQLVQAPLLIGGTTGNDQISLSLSGSMIVSRVNGVKTRTPVDQVASITVIAGAGNDTVIINPGVMGALILGGGGNDTLTGGDGNDTIKGGAGNDLIHGGRGDDFLKGNAGDDTLYGNAGNDTLNGGAGRDLMYGGGGNDTFIAKDGQSDTLVGGAGSDTATVDDLLDSRMQVEVLLK